MHIQAYTKGQTHKQGHSHTPMFSQTHNCAHSLIHTITLEVCCASQNSHLLNQQSRLVLMRNNEPSLNNNSLDGFHLHFRFY